MKLNNDDHQTVLTYFTARHRDDGYKGPCFINLKRLAEIHLSGSKEIALSAINKAKQVA